MYIGFEKEWDNTYRRFPSEAPKNTGPYMVVLMTEDIVNPWVWIGSYDASKDSGWSVLVFMGQGIVVDYSSYVVGWLDLPKFCVMDRRDRRRYIRAEE